MDKRAEKAPLRSQLASAVFICNIFYFDKRGCSFLAGRSVE